MKAPTWVRNADWLTVCRSVEWWYRGAHARMHMMPPNGACSAGHRWPISADGCEDPGWARRSEGTLSGQKKASGRKAGDGAAVVLEVLVAALLIVVGVRREGTVELTQA